MNTPFHSLPSMDDSSIRDLADAICRVWQEFPRDEFSNKIRQKKAEEIEERAKECECLDSSSHAKLVADQLLTCLPPSIPQALKILTDCLPSPQKNSGETPNYSWVWPIATFIREYADEFWEETMAAIHKLCQCGNAEYAIRPMLKLFPQKTMQRLLQWCEDPSARVRRFCCEVCRLRAPWASRLELPRHLVIPILLALKYDGHSIVQDSVARHLADLGKTDESWLLNLMREWWGTGNTNAQAIARKALRGWIKEGNAEAYSILEIKPLDIERTAVFVTPRQVGFGEEVKAKLELTGEFAKGTRLLVHWVVHYPRDGRVPFRKVYHGEEIELDEDSIAYVCEKTFCMTPYSTKRLVPGPHRLEVQINGRTIAEAEFCLLDRRGEKKNSEAGSAIEA